MYQPPDGAVNISRTAEFLGIFRTEADIEPKIAFLNRNQRGSGRRTLVYTNAPSLGVSTALVRACSLF